MTWRVFQMRELAEAYEHARKGGFAVHVMDDITGDAFPNAPRVFRGKRFAHLFGPTRGALIEAAKSLGCNPRWVQRDDDDKRRHFDLTGRILEKALARCVR